jgi:hypothetical protein
VGVGAFHELSMHGPDGPGEPQAGVERHYLGREYARFEAEGAHDVENDPGVQALKTFGQAPGRPAVQFAGPSA